MVVENGSIYFEDAKKSIDYCARHRPDTTIIVPAWPWNHGVEKYDNVRRLQHFEMKNIDIIEGIVKEQKEIEYERSMG